MKFYWIFEAFMNLKHALINIRSLCLSQVNLFLFKPQLLSQLVSSYIHRANIMQIQTESEQRALATPALRIQNLTTNSLDHLHPHETLRHRWSWKKGPLNKNYVCLNSSSMVQKNIDCQTTLIFFKIILSEKEPGFKCLSRTSFSVVGTHNKFLGSDGKKTLSQCVYPHNLHFNTLCVV